MNDIIETIRIDMGEKSFKGIFNVFHFMDHEHFISYMPSLNLSGYGDSYDEANDFLFKIVLDDYVNNLFSLGNKTKIFNVLKEHGWVADQYRGKHLSKSVHVDKEGILQEFNLPKETPVESELVEI